MYDSMGRWGERGTAEESQCAEESAEGRACDLSRGTPAHAPHAPRVREGEPTRSFLIGDRFFVVCVCDTHTACSVRSCD